MACRDPGGAKCAGTQTASALGFMALSEFFLFVFFLFVCFSFFEPLAAGYQKASLASLSL